MKRLFLLLLLCAASAFAQDLRPSAYLGLPGKITVRGGKILGASGGVTTIAEQTITPANSATTYVYIDLSGTPAVATSTSAFPNSSYFPICIVVKDANGTITSFTDSRPDSFMAAGGAAANSPIPPNQAQGPTYNVLNYGAKGTAKKVTDCASTAASKIFTSATAQWTQADVGSVFWMTYLPNSNSNISTSVTTIASVQSATQITIGAGQANQTATAQYCFWGPQDDTSSIQAAVTAADVANTNKAIQSGPTLAMPGNIYFPKGGYIVSSTIVSTCWLGSGNQICPNFYGAGQERTNFYVTPNFTGPSHGTFLLASVNSVAQTIQGFSMTDGGVQVSADFPFLYLNGTYMNVRDISFSAFGWQHEVIQCDTCSYSILENIHGQGSCASCFAPLLTILNGSAPTLHDIFVSNGATNLNIQNVSLRTSQGSGALLHGVSVDECGSATVACTQIVNSNANIVGGAFFGNAIGAISVDATSQAYLTDVNAGQFNTGNPGIALAIASGGKVYATGSHIRGNGTGFAVSGPAGALFADLGGNVIQNCSFATCTDITAATYATQGFTGGIVPKATVTHTPNTCYAVTGNLLATAQNLCTFINDQNYQILNVTAQSGGTTPANSACATPPVITFSDGTRTATLTMTTGKTQWSSAVDAYTGANQVFASGTTLTISIGANTCATPPANVSVSYVLQSVLNP